MANRRVDIVDFDPVFENFRIHISAMRRWFFWGDGTVIQKQSNGKNQDFFRNKGTFRFDFAPCPQFDYPDDFDRKKFDTWLGLPEIKCEPQVEDLLVNIGAAERSERRLSIP